MTQVFYETILFPDEVLLTPDADELNAPAQPHPPGLAGSLIRAANAVAKDFSDTMQRHASQPQHLLRPTDILMKLRVDEQSEAFILRPTLLDYENRGIIIHAQLVTQSPFVLDHIEQEIAIKPNNADLARSVCETFFVKITKPSVPVSGTRPRLTLVAATSAKEPRPR